MPPMAVSAQLAPQQPASPLSGADVVAGGLGPASVSSRNRLLIEASLSWRHRKCFAVAALVGMLLSLAIALLIPRTYEAKTELIASDSFPGSSFVAGVENPELLTSMLRSNTVRDQLVDRFDLRRVYRVDTYHEAREKLAARTNLRSQRASGLVTITVSDRDPQRACDLARAYVEELNRSIIALNALSAHNLSVFLKERINVAHRELETSSQRLGKFSSENTAVALDAQSGSSVRTLTTLEKKEIKRKSEARALAQIYGPQHIGLRVLQAQLAHVQSKTAQMAGPHLDQRPGFRTADQLLPTMGELPFLTETYADLDRTVTDDQNVLNALAVEQELTQFRELNNNSNVQVIDWAQPPEESSGPPRLLIVIIGTVLSLICARLVASRFSRPRLLSIESADLSRHSKSSTLLYL